MSTMGERIRENRKRAGLTQEQLAKKIGVSMMSIRRYEKDERIVTNDTLQKIADALDVKISDIKYDGAAKSFTELYTRLEEDGVKLSPEEAYKMHKRQVIAAFDKLGPEDQKEVAQQLRSAVYDGEDGYPAHKFKFSVHKRQGFESLSPEGQKKYLAEEWGRLSESTQDALKSIEQLSTEGLKKLAEYAADLAKIPDYQKSPQPSSEAPQEPNNPHKDKGPEKD